MRGWMETRHGTAPMVICWHQGCQGCRHTLTEAGPIFGGSSHLGGFGVDAERGRHRRAPLDGRAVPPPRRGGARDRCHQVDEAGEEVEGARVLAQVQEEEPRQPVDRGRGGAPAGRERFPEFVVEDDQR